MQPSSAVGHSPGVLAACGVKHSKVLNKTCKTAWQSLMEEVKKYCMFEINGEFLRGRTELPKLESEFS